MTQEIAHPAPAHDADRPSGARKPWQTPVIEDADIAGLTHGTGTSGVEGTPFLKPGS